MLTEITNKPNNINVTLKVKKGKKITDKILTQALDEIGRIHCPNGEVASLEYASGELESQGLQSAGGNIFIPVTKTTLVVFSDITCG